MRPNQFQSRIPPAYHFLLVSLEISLDARHCSILSSPPMKKIMCPLTPHPSSGVPPCQLQSPESNLSDGISNPRHAYTTPIPHSTVPPNELSPLEFVFPSTDRWNIPLFSQLECMHEIRLYAVRLIRHSATNNVIAAYGLHH